MTGAEPLPDVRTLLEGAQPRLTPRSTRSAGLTTIDGCPIIVGVGYDTVTISGSGRIDRDGGIADLIRLLGLAHEIAGERELQIRQALMDIDDE